VRIWDYEQLGLVEWPAFFTGVSLAQPARAGETAFSIRNPGLDTAADSPQPARPPTGINKRGDMNRSTVFLRIAYWAGAILDAAMLPPMLVPAIGGAIFGIPDFHPGAEYRYAMGVGASLMLGWTLLLIWADRKPVERREVLLLTLPVIFGLIGSNAFAAVCGLVSPGRILPILVLQFSLMVFFLGAYIGSRKAYYRRTDAVFSQKPDRGGL
jgi:hypothetical protein